MKHDTISAKEFAERQGVSVRTAQRIFYAGAVPTVLVSRRRRMTEQTYRKRFIEREA